MTMLASDLNNTEFVGATNPDALMYVEFYWHEPVDKWASEEESAKQGKRVVVKREKEIFVRIMRPGDQQSILETRVREEHKQRWPDKWLYFQISEGLVDGGADVPGWKLEDWPHLDEQQDLLRELKFARFHTVEQIAGAQDHQVQKLGIGGPGLREVARVALRERMRKEFATDLAEKERTIAAQGQALAELQKQVAALMNQAPSQPKQENPEREALVAQYTEKHGKKPHHKLSIEKIRAALG